MASVPAETSSSNMPAARGDDTGESRSDLIFGFNRLNLLRQVGLMVGLAASVALGVAVVLWAQEPNYQPVVGDMSGYNPQDVTTILDANNIDYRMDPRTGALLVPSDEVYNARLKLAAEGVTDEQTMGYELLDQDRGLGTSQFMETISFRRGLEGELARTIGSMRTVRAARVHLAIPERSVFVRDARTPTASVFLEVIAGRRLEQEQIASIVNLVAGSIPEMSKDNVTVVDQSGNLLTGREDGGDSQQIEDQYDYTSRVEDRLARRVASMVRPVVGDGRFRAEVTADLDFSSVEQAEELFNPEQQAVRSERQMSERRAGGGASGIPGALSNQPPAQPTVPEQATADDEGNVQAPPVNVREESTRNYEMDRTVSYIRQELGRIKRLSVALAVDDMKVVDPQTGEVSYEPWPEQELQRLTMLVRDAVGYSAARGDSVTVMNTAFAAEEQIEFEAPAFWEQPWFWDLMKQVLAGLVILVLVLGLLRPTLKSLSGGGRSERRGDSDDGYDGLDGIEGGDALREAMHSQDDLLLPGATDSYDRQLNALKGLIAEDPARVSQVMRQWVNVDD
ncbi:MULTISPECIES: flagellar basal-body MS-ring/collar protein FliF [Pseudomonadota]|jgi:flagellar M-ring protein FliF|uniref:Flagellar M-ring protein n=1 Tax=Marinobacter salarius TaxID=1420917 RepID=A0A1W6K883_9GAMM|nr:MULTISPECIES: flagellar basal-body MS-ring/collar protein FliF [Marinobacter]ARM83610.1 flagellar M-ring protein [Marinobacter salarius]AZR42449.1 flagellar M-ring protein [Marinobacter salarius]KXJ44781.1 MAG: flagellar M-ring protein FliF [Marinobacter sp. Hex_13]MAB51315.1 flagellar basal body M-ring protein FliF [Marinobacter sp.]MBS8231721.1 flagellar basal body M-ring protein FliF [Marinobacter salarius]|tara:strand:+ start:352 stop:2049 length:1698 start_codon:yes stop_codon:yes gene_type:complete